MLTIIFRTEDVSINTIATGIKVPMITGNIIINGQIFKGASGGWGNGPLPSGIYTVERATKLPNTKENATYLGEQFPWYARLTPQFYTSRNGLLIHPKGKFVGTLGCVETWERDVDLFNLLTKVSLPCQLKVL